MFRNLLEKFLDWVEDQEAATRAARARKSLQPDFERLDDRFLMDAGGLPLPLVVTAPGPGPSFTQKVHVHDGETGAKKFTITPFGPGHTSGITVALTDITGDGIPDVLSAQAQHGNGTIRAHSASTAVISVTSPTRANYHGGLHLAGGVDWDGDGIGDFAAAPNNGQGKVKVISGADGSVLHTVTPYQQGGARPALGDVTGDQHPDLITATGIGPRARVHVWDGVSGSLVQTLVPFGQDFREGLFVTTGDVSGDCVADVIVGAARAPVGPGLYHSRRQPVRPIPGPRGGRVRQRGARGQRPGQQRWNRRHRHRQRAGDAHQCPRH